MGKGLRDGGEDTDLTLMEDPSREIVPKTGVYFRAKEASGKWGTVDLAHLTLPSLLNLLHSKEHVWVSALVCVLLGHEVDSEEAAEAIWEQATKQHLADHPTGKETH